MNIIDIVNTADTLSKLSPLQAWKTSQAKEEKKEKKGKEGKEAKEGKEEKGMGSYMIQSMLRILEKEPYPKSTSPYQVVQTQNGQTRTFIGKYELTNTILGNGGNSVVHLGYGPTMKKVAIKCIHVSPQRMAKIKRDGLSTLEEVKFMKGLIHPSIPKILDTYATGTFLYLVLEFVEGVELFDALKAAGTFSEERARRILIQILSCLQYLHSNNILHNDLKLENLLVGPDDRISLIDFGHASRRENRIARGVATLEYAPPEILQFGIADFSSDVWSLGVVLFAMICGFFPFDGKQEEVRKMIVQANLNFATKQPVSEDCKDLIRKMIEPEPSRRISLEEIKSHPWYLQGLHYYDFTLSSLSP